MIRHTSLREVVRTDLLRAVSRSDLALSKLGTGIIIVVNDNEMSIAENHGGIYKNLRALRQSNGTCEHKLDQEKAQSKAQHKEKVKVKTKDRGVEL